MDVLLSNNAPADANPLRDRLAETHGGMVARADELLEGVKRVPDRLDEGLVERATSFVKQLKGHAKVLDGTRTTEKEPYLEGSRTVDGYFQKPIERLKAGAAAVEARIGTFLREKAAAERAAREAAERAAAISTEADLAEAIAAEGAATAAQDAARRAERAADAKPAELARTRGALGGVATLRTTLAFRRTGGRVDLEALRPFLAEDEVDKAVRAFARVHERAGLLRDQPLAGVEFFEQSAALVA